MSIKDLRRLVAALLSHPDEHQVSKLAVMEDSFNTEPGPFRIRDQSLTTLFEPGIERLRLVSD